MEISASRCRRANTCRSGSRAIDPSSLTISHSAPAGCSPASRGQVDGRLGVPGPDQHAALPGAQREDVAGPGQVLVGGLRVGQQADGVRPLGRRDAGGDALLGVHADGEGGGLAVLVQVVHRRQVEPVAGLAGEPDAHHAGGVADGEAHQFGGGQLGGEDQVALVLPVLVVDDDDRPTGGDLGDGEVDGVESGLGLGPVGIPVAGAASGRRRRTGSRRIRWPGRRSHRRRSAVLGGGGPGVRDGAEPGRRIRRNSRKGIPA